MSNKTRLQTNNTNLQSLINKANALPDAGSGGGGGNIETTTLAIMTDYTSMTRNNIYIGRVCCSIYENGIISSGTALYDDQNVQIPNVIMGSDVTILLTNTSGLALGIETYNTATVITQQNGVASLRITASEAGYSVINLYNMA